LIKHYVGKNCFVFELIKIINMFLKVDLLIFTYIEYYEIGHSSKNNPLVTNKRDYNMFVGRNIILLFQKFLEFSKIT